jgi:fructose-1,6-bisphosphatase/inositol monophosphatase family enzyme
MSEDPDRLFIDTFRLAALQAVAVALHLSGKVTPETKSAGNKEAQALTAVDLATQDVILRLLHRQLPEVAVDAEEETDTLAFFAGEETGRPLVVVDPVDGTLNYIRGSSEFAVMGGLLRDGCYTAALIHFPVHGDTYWAIRGAGCFGNGIGAPRRLQAGRAENRIYRSSRTPAAWREALRARAGALEISHCSALDASAPATQDAVIAPVGNSLEIQIELPVLLRYQAVERGKEDQCSRR